MRVPSSYSWIVTKRFQFDGGRGDQELLSALTAHEQYADHYAGQPVAEQTHRSLHGPYRLADIESSSFTASTAPAATTLLTQWVTRCATEGRPVPHSELATFLESQLPRELVRPDVTVYRLPDIRAQSEHDWGWVVGTNGFHEFIVIDHSEERLSLIVASDD